MPNQIAKWGVEIEAGWKPLCGFNGIKQSSCSNHLKVPCHHDHLDLKGLAFPWNIEHDGSIRLSNESYGIAQELTSSPIESKKELKKDMEILWHKISQINDSMGFHIHVSMAKRKTYYLLSSWEYVDMFQKLALLSPELAVRLNNNQFCRRYTSKADFINKYKKQVSFKDKHEWRYQSLNFTWSRYRTIEYRLFPMNQDITKMFSYMDMVEDTINEFVDKNENGSNIRNIAALKAEDSTSETFKIKPVEIEFETIARPTIVSEFIGKITSRAPTRRQRDKDGYVYRVGDSVMISGLNFTLKYLSGDEPSSILSLGTFKNTRTPGIITERYSYESLDPDFKAFKGRKYYRVRFNDRYGHYIDESDLMIGNRADNNSITNNGDYNIRVGNIVTVSLRDHAENGIVRTISNTREGVINCRVDFPDGSSNNYPSNRLTVLPSWLSYSIPDIGDTVRIKASVDNSEMLFGANTSRSQIFLQMLSENVNREVIVNGIAWWTPSRGSPVPVISFIPLNPSPDYPLAYVSIVDIIWVRSGSGIDNRNSDTISPRFANMLSDDEPSDPEPDDEDYDDSDDEPEFRSCFICSSEHHASDYEWTFCDFCYRAYCQICSEGPLHIYNCHICNVYVCATCATREFHTRRHVTINTNATAQ